MKNGENGGVFIGWKLVPAQRHRLSAFLFTSSMPDCKVVAS